MDEDDVQQPRRYQIEPRKILIAWGSSVLVAILIVGSIMAFTPVRQLIPGYSTEEIERSAQLSAVRVAALQDTLAVQSHYIERLQQLITGRVETSENGDDILGGHEYTPGSDDRMVSPEGNSWAFHEQPALTLTYFGGDNREMQSMSASEHTLPALSTPIPPPVESGYPTRGFDPRSGHYALDIAVQEGAFVRTVGDGYVVFADWTQEGGYTVAIQHGGGYLSIYKHNERVLKRVGDHVQEQEVIAVTGNTGEITTGPHLHFELWHHGLAQDPRALIAGW